MIALKMHTLYKRVFLKNQILLLSSLIRCFVRVSGYIFIVLYTLLQIPFFLFSFS